MKRQNLRPIYIILIRTSLARIYTCWLLLFYRCRIFP